ncbi:MAG TPA: SUMF1/EgtB/PvdO family nonheme iron enzyme [Sedimentisphaerales bacterium]|nr:SUMF1/EgtB/PvdO family nonheme iron enzyme [Sedimentisphaerales bacterium]
MTGKYRAGPCFAILGKTGLPAVLLCMLVATALSAEMPTDSEFTNSIGMKFVRLRPGKFVMGQLRAPLPPEILPEFRGRGLFDNLSEGDFDEKPVHSVKITRPFYIGVYEVTNKQYELFDAEHKELRGKNGFSREDDEAVINVSWYDAQAFCRWLSDKDGLPYRLPTEAEWEYACRAGTKTNYYAGDILPDAFLNRGSSLHVGMTPANAWGIYDMHGNVEEWCLDWYGPYKDIAQTDPVGYVQGDFRVVRGGGHSTDVYYLRSANRMGALPEDKTWLMGFRIVLGELPDTGPLPAPRPPLYQRYVIQRDAAAAAAGTDADKPCFKGPRKYVKIPTEANGPLFAAHNHDPAIVECPNGDLLAIWYTCVAEKGRELAQAVSRLRRGAEEWEPASRFWDVPDRNDHAPALWFDGKDTIYHFNGMSFGGGHGVTAVVMRTSEDSGATWSRARIILPDYASGRMPSEPVFRMNDGAIALAVDHSGPWGNGSDLWISRNEGFTWSNPGGHVAGIHAGVAQLKDGRLVGFGREGEIVTNGRKQEMKSLPMSISEDGGNSYTWHETEFPPIGGAQRLVLLRLQKGPLFLASFANTGTNVTDAAGQQRQVRGLYGAVSEDGGKTWPYKRLITDDGPGRQAECTGGGLFIMSGRNAEYRGYLAVCQSADGLINLISSREHYAFNLKWLRTPPPPLSAPPVRVERVVESFNGPKRFDADGWVDYHSYVGGFNGRGQYTINSMTHHNGINRIIGAGSFEVTLAVSKIHYNPVRDRVSEGLAIWIKDDRSRFVAVAIKEDHIKLEVTDAETASPPPGAQHRTGRGWMWEKEQARYDKPPRSAKLKFIWNEQSKQMRVFYGLDGAEAVNELPQSEAGICFAKPFSESTVIYILMSNGTIDVDHFEIRPVNLQNVVTRQGLLRDTVIKG